jgi:hypothetical protein
MTSDSARRRLCTAATFCCAAVIFGFCSPAGAGVQEFEDEERPLWFDAASDLGPITTIGFSEFGDGVLITEQYAHLGVHFTFLGNFTIGESFSVFPQDGWGLDGNTMIRLEFDDVQSGIAFDFPGAAEVDLFRDGELVHDSSRFGGSGAGRFGGVVGIEFDLAIIVDWTGDQVFLDDLHFVSVPVPGGLTLVGMLLALPSRRRPSR